MTAPKTPGVYIEMQEKLPAVIVQPKTAVPAFIGYTATTRRGGHSLVNVPVEIGSLSEYISIFGGPPGEQELLVSLDPQANFQFHGFRRAPVAMDRDYPYILFDSLRLYFDNGGQECFIVSVGSHSDAPALGDPENAVSNPGFRTGIQALKKVDGPTLLLFPDAVLLAETALYRLQAEALAHCAMRQDRFALFDLANLPDLSTSMTNFRDGIGTNHLKYGAAFAPWVQRAYPVAINFRNLRFQNTGQEDLVLAQITPRQAWKDLVNAMHKAIADTDQVNSAIEAAVITTPIQQYTSLKEAFLAALETTVEADIQSTFHAILEWAKDIILLFPTWVSPQSHPAQSLQSAEMLGFVHSLARKGFGSQVHAYIRFLLHPDVVYEFYGGSSPGNFTSFDPTRWLPTAVALITPDLSIDFGTTTVSIATNAFAAFEAVVFPGPTGNGSTQNLDLTVQKVQDAALQFESKAQDLLFSQHPIVSQVIERLRTELSLLPCSGAVAGAIVHTDSSTGVWKAPANIDLQSIAGLAVYVNNATQDGMNVDPNSGKSINALRAFPGRGIRIFGSRTLAGNDPEWRYISVRRLFLTIETTLAQTLAQVVFEANNLNTWVRIKVLVNGYLNEMWRAGALRGTTPADAYLIKVGLGETMTQQDILEGRLRVEIGLAAIRPAEFIRLKFTFLLQETIS